ncbi:MAG: hypothetical protein ACXAEU_26550, partial [Candidatus Hodarchaeales archaeon]
MQCVNSILNASSYGSGSTWYGARMQTQLTEDITDFNLTLLPYCQYIVNGMGKICVSLNSSTGDRIFAVYWYDAWVSTAYPRISLHNNETDVYETE